MIEPEVLAEALLDLGPDPDAIAANLAQRGIRGKRGDTECCPVANYLKTQFEEYTPSVAPTMTLLYEGSPYGAVTPYVKTMTPDPVKRFIIEFDDDVYPDLIDGSDSR